MEEELRRQIVPGAKVRVVEQIARGTRTWKVEVRGTVLSYEQRPTGSWFAHSQGGRLWLDRLVIRKDDGEISTLNLDRQAQITVEAAPSASVAGFTNT